MEAEGFRRDLAERLQDTGLYQGLETEKIFAAVIVAALADAPVETSEVAALLEERDRRLFFEILFEESQEPSWEEAESCVEALHRRKLEHELASLQRDIEGNPAGGAMRELLLRKQELMKRLGSVG